MSKYIGDFAEDAVFNCKFSTVNLSQVPTTLAGTPVIKCYKAGATDSETATGVTLTVDFDGVTGLNNIAVDLSSDAFYATGNNYSLVITTGTVDSISVVGSVVKEFSIENRFMRGTDSAFLAASAPTNFSSLGIESDGDLTKVNLCDTNTDMYSSVMRGTDNALLAANVPTNFSSLGIESDGDLTKVNALDGQTAQTGDSYAVVNSGTFGNSALKTLIDALNDISAADILTTALTEAYAADGAERTLTQILYELKAFLTQFGIVGTAYTTKKLDGTTTAKVYTTDDATDPAAITETT